MGDDYQPSWSLLHSLDYDTMWPQERAMDLKLNDKVRWKSTAGLPEGEGLVKGFASVEMAVIGRNVIIEVTEPSAQEALSAAGYHFTHLCLFESQIEKVP